MWEGEGAITCALGDKVFRDVVMNDVEQLTRLHREENWNFDENLWFPWLFVNIYNVTKGPQNGKI